MEAGLWSNLLGRKMTARLRKLILPDLVWNQEIYGRLLRQYVTGQARWLDAGCGWRSLGEDLEPLEDAIVGSARMSVGCDLDFANIAKHRNLDRLAVASLDNLPFKDGSFDVVSCNMVVEHLVNPRQAFREIARVLATNGVLVIHTPNLRNYAVFLNHTVARVLPRKFILRMISSAENRDKDDVFPTFYRANTIGRMKRICGDLHLHEESARVLTAPQPFFGFLAPVALIQILIMRVTLWKPFRGLGQTILAVFRKTG